MRKVHVAKLRRALRALGLTTAENPEANDLLSEAPDAIRGAHGETVPNEGGAPGTHSQEVGNSREAVLNTYEAYGVNGARTAASDNASSGGSRNGALNGLLIATGLEGGDF